MRALWLALSVGTALALQAQESSQSRLDAAESGAKDVSWPRRPDNRSSPLSGKMKDFREIPSQEYGGAKEFRSERLYEDRQASSLASVPPKSMAESAFAKKSDTSFVKDSALADQDIPHASDSVFSVKRRLESVRRGIYRVRRQPDGPPVPVARGNRVMEPCKCTTGD